MMQQPRLWLAGACLVSTFSCGGPEVGPSPGPGSIVISTMTQRPGSDRAMALPSPWARVMRAPIGMMGAVQLDNPFEAEGTAYGKKLEGMTPNCSVESRKIPSLWS